MSNRAFSSRKIEGHWEYCIPSGNGLTSGAFSRRCHSVIFQFWPHYTLCRHLCPQWDRVHNIAPGLKLFVYFNPGFKKKNVHSIVSMSSIFTSFLNICSCLEFLTDNKQHFWGTAARVSISRTFELRVSPSCVATSSKSFKGNVWNKMYYLSRFPQRSTTIRVDTKAADGLTTRPPNSPAGMPLLYLRSCITLTLHALPPRMIPKLCSQF